jgi:hypothetical protein
MLTLDAKLHIPVNVSFSVVGADAFLLNAQTNKYYGLEQVGARLWQILAAGKTLKEAHLILLNEYEVDANQLAQDLLELLEDLQKNGLVEIVEA